MSDLDNNLNQHLDKSYRYFDIDGALKTLNEMKLRFTRYDSLNDPLDGSSLIISDSITENAKKRTLELLKNTAYSQYRYSIKKRRKLISIGIESINSHQNINPNEILAFNKLYFTCCFSKNYFSPDSFLLWSYYADKHHGICFEFDFSEFILKPFEVYYPPTLSKLSTDINYYDVRASELRKFLVQKQSCWKHEEEVRLIASENMLKESGIEYSINDKYLKIELKKKFLTKIIFGYSTKDADIKSIKSLVNELYLDSEFAFEKMDIDRNTFEFMPREY